MDATVAPVRVALAGLIASGYSGVPRYAIEAARAIDRVAGDYPRLRFELVTTAVGARAVSPANIGLRIVGRRTPGIDRGPVRLVAEQTVLPFLRSDLVHFFDLLGPFAAPRLPFTTTVHDVKVFEDPDAFSLLARAYKRVVLPLAARRARAVLAISAVAREQAIRVLDADPARVHVVHSGPGFLPEPTQRPTIEVGDRPFFLHVGQIAANKNLPFLVRAFSVAGVDARLLLVGRPKAGYDETMATIRDSSAQDRIEVITEASDADVDLLYRRALALVMPSRYEGFGFTPLEAMQRGCPVVVSDIRALEEVAGGGSMVLPLDDQAAWAQAMRRIVVDEGLRTELAGRGRAHVEGFSWDRTGRGICEMIDRVAVPRTRR